MADQGKWFKLWESSLDDQDLENLSVHEWFCWARFGTYLKKHGKEGKIRLRAPATAVTNLLRLSSFKDVIDVLKRFPNYTIDEGQNVTANVTSEFVTYNIRCINWSKYQGDFSGDRVREYRRRVTANVTVQEEKRGEETKSPLSPKSSPSKAALRSAPPDAPAPLRAAVVLGDDERPEHGHNDFIEMGWRDPREPADAFGWDRLANTLSLEERVQSKVRERLYGQNGAVQARQPAKAGGDDDVF